MTFFNQSEILQRLSNQHLRWSMTRAEQAPMGTILADGSLHDREHATEALQYLCMVYMAGTATYGDSLSQNGVARVANHVSSSRKLRSVDWQQAELKGSKGIY